MTSVSDIIDHAVVGIAAGIPIAIPVILQSRSARKSVKAARTQLEQTTAKVDAASAKVDHLHREMTCDDQGESRLQRIEDKLDDHISDSVEFWEDQAAELHSVAMAVARHMNDPDPHTTPTAIRRETQKAAPGHPSLSKAKQARARGEARVEDHGRDSRLAHEIEERTLESQKKLPPARPARPRPPLSDPSD